MHTETKLLKRIGEYREDLNKLERDRAILKEAMHDIRDIVMVDQHVALAIIDKALQEISHG